MIIREDALDKDGLCPICQTKPDKMCELDRVCMCPGTIHSGIFYCSLCGKPICPCGSHSVAQISRVTGYLAEVGGWAAHKQQELKDRKRYNIGLE